MRYKIKPNLESLLDRVVPSATSPEASLEPFAPTSPAELEAFVNTTSVLVDPCCTEHGDSATRTPVLPDSSTFRIDRTRIVR